MTEPVIAAAAVVQALAAVAQVGLAFVLWRATTRYVGITSEQLSELREQQSRLSQREASAARAAISRIKTVLRDLPQSLPEGYAKMDLDPAPRWSEHDVELAIGTSDRLAPVPEGIRLREHLDALERIRSRYASTPEPVPTTSGVDRLEWQERIQQAKTVLLAMDGALETIAMRPGAAAEQR